MSNSKSNTNSNNNSKERLLWPIKIKRRPRRNLLTLLSTLLLTMALLKVLCSMILCSQRMPRLVDREVTLTIHRLVLLLRVFPRLALTLRGLQKTFIMLRGLKLQLDSSNQPLRLQRKVAPLRHHKRRSSSLVMTS
jgi:hypothetical protein